MNTLEIISALLLSCPPAFAAGVACERQKDSDSGLTKAVILFALGVVTGTVTITLRLAN